MALALHDAFGHPNQTATDVDLPHDYVGVRHAAVAWALTAAATVFLALRVYCKQCRHRGLWWDDYILLVSWVCCLLFPRFHPPPPLTPRLERPTYPSPPSQVALVVQVAILTKQLDYDLGRHIWDLTTTEYTDDFELLGLIGLTSIVCGMAWSKTAFAVTLLRLSEARLRAFLWFVLLTINLFMMGGVLVRWLQCWPVQRGWDPTATGSCWDETISINISIATAGLSPETALPLSPAVATKARADGPAVYSGAMDLVLAVLPWTIIWKLPMQPREKFGTALAMSMGVFAAATAFVKSAKIPKVAAGDFTCEFRFPERGCGWEGGGGRHTNPLLSEDEVSDLLIWGVAEVVTTIIAASIPVLRVLVLEAAQSSGGGRRGHAGGGGEPGPARQSRLWGHTPLNLTVTTIKRLSTASATTCPSSGSSNKGTAADGTLTPGSGGGIRVRDEVKVDFEDRRDTDVEAFRDPFGVRRYSLASR